MCPVARGPHTAVSIAVSVDKQALYESSIIINTTENLDSSQGKKIQ